MLPGGSDSYHSQVNSGNLPITKDLVLLGGGHAHVEVLKSFAMRPLPGVRLTLVTKDVDTPYSGMLPGLVAGHYEFDEAHVDLRPLARLAGARIIHATAGGLDVDDNRLKLLGRPSLHFDVLSINTGSTPGLKAVPGAADHAVPVKPIERFLVAWKKKQQRIREQNATSDRRFQIVVVGGGAGGVELLLSMREALLKELAEEFESLDFRLITGADTILPTHAPGVRERYLRILRQREVSVIKGKSVAEVGGRAVICEGGEKFTFDALFWVTNASPAAWVEASGLDHDEAGFIQVNSFLQSPSHESIFAAGDIATMVDAPRPKSGVFAVRQGPPLAKNLRAVLSGTPMTPHRPQKRFLSLISTGDQRAVASYGPWAAEGEWVWRWKDWIDRRWMRQYQDVDLIQRQMGSMAEAAAVVGQEADEARMRCGGCGAKVAARVLRKALDRLQRSAGIDLDASDDAALIDLPMGKGLVQSVDFFREFLGDPFLFGMVSAHHCLNDLFAMGASPHSALATVVVPYGDESVIEETVFQMLSGAATVLKEHGAILAGGHTSEGAEAAFGLTVNGAVDCARLLKKKGLRSGDQLILTKALGTGAIFAADMRSRAKGRWVAGAVDSMLLSNAKAAGVIANVGAEACTDVTGFGLLGHLGEMLADSNLGADLWIDQLPLLAGVGELLTDGYGSSLAPSNQAAVIGDYVAEGISAGQLPILFDPQTAGGLLAGVAVEQTETCLNTLTPDYPNVSQIGHVRPRQSGEPAIRILSGRPKDVRLAERVRIERTSRQ